MSSAAIVTSAPANSRPELEATANNTRADRRGGKGRRRRQAAEQRLIEQQRWGQYLEDEDGDFSVVVPPTPVNTRRRARRTSRRNSARDDLEEYLNGTGDDKFGASLAHEDELDLDVALALSLSLADSGAFSQFGRSQATIIDMTYESLVQLEDVRCVTSTAIVSALPVCCTVKEQAPFSNQAPDVCVICQVEYGEGEVQMKLPCLHKFHQACGAEWLLNYSKLCPVCKHDVTETSGPSSV